MKSRDATIELARIIGCLLVIGDHIALPIWRNGQFDFTNGFILSLFANGVAIFWMISGCFMFGEKSYKSLIIRAVRSVFIPALLYFAFVFFLLPYMNGAVGLAGLKHPMWEYINIIADLLSLKTSVTYTLHLWYVFTYGLVILAFPLLNAFANWLDEDAAREKCFLIISFVLFVLNDLSKNRIFAFSHVGLTAAVPAAIMCIWGHILYRHKKDILAINRGMVRAGFLLLILVVNAIRTFLVSVDFAAIVGWFAASGLICASVVLCLCMESEGKVSAQNKIGKAIGYVSSYTFFIYIFHMMVIAVGERFWLFANLKAWMSRYLPAFPYKILYDICVVTAIFVVSLACGVLFRTLSIPFKKIFKKKKMVPGHE